MTDFDVNIISSYLSHSYKSSLLNLDLASVIFEVPFLSQTGDLLDYCIIGIRAIGLLGLKTTLQTGYHSHSLGYGRIS